MPWVIPKVSPAAGYFLTSRMISDCSEVETQFLSVVAGPTAGPGPPCSWLDPQTLPGGWVVQLMSMGGGGLGPKQPEMRRYHETKHVHISSLAPSAPTNMLF